jgi:hypothetical protein
MTARTYRYISTCVVSLELQCTVERISGQLALKIEEIEMPENPNRSARLGFKGSGWPPASTKELLAVRYRMTSAEVEVDLMDAIGINRDEILMTRFFGWAGTARRVANLNSKALFAQCCLLEK